MIEEQKKSRREIDKPKDILNTALSVGGMHIKHRLVCKKAELKGF